MTPFEQNQTHKNSIDHRKDIETNEICGCFYCIQTFPPSRIRHWTDNEKTAICPLCNVDAVIGDKSGFIIDKAFFKIYEEYLVLIRDYNTSRGALLNDFFFFRRQQS